MKELIAHGSQLLALSFFRMRLITFVLVTIFILSLTIMVEGAEFRIQPSITIGEEYNDNIFLQKEEKVDDYITGVLPSITLEYKAPIWEWDINYAFDYRYYAKGSRGDDTTHALGANGHIEILNEFFFIDISDEYRRVSLDVTRDFTRESLFVNQSDRNIFNLNPYFVLRPTSLITVTTGYIFSDIWFKEETTIDRTDNIAYVDSAFELSPKVTLNAGYKYTQEDSNVMDYDKNDISLGSQYEYAGESYLFFTVGNSWLDFKGANSYNHIFWNARITHKFPTFTGSLESALDYVKDPSGDLIKENSYVMSLSKTIEMASLGISISFREFRDAVNKVLETRSYGTNGDIRYELTPKMIGTFDFTVEKIEEKLENTYTRRYLPILGIDYMLSGDLTLAFVYHYADSYSPKIEENNYKNNRFILEVRKSF